MKLASVRGDTDDISDTDETDTRGCHYHPDFLGLFFIDKDDKDEDFRLEDEDRQRVTKSY